MNRVLLATLAVVALAAPVASLAFGARTPREPAPMAAAPPAAPSPAMAAPGMAAGSAAAVPGVGRTPVAQPGITVVPSGVELGKPAPPRGALAPPGPAPAAFVGNAMAPGASLAADAQPADPLAAWGRPPAPGVDPRRFTEAHWQGLEVVPNTPTLARMLNMPPDLAGVIVDDVTLPADLQGFKAGDLVMQVGGQPTTDLLGFIDATALVRAQPNADVVIWRNGVTRTMRMVALRQRLGTANGETPSMIPPNARMPHPYRGPCTNCHRIGTTGTLNADQGDPMPTGVPDIRVGARRPHEDRGPCNVCHRILP